MTEGLIVFSTFIVSVLLVDPFFAGGLTKAVFAKGLVYAFGFGSLGFHCLGRAATSPERFSAALREVAAAWWPLILLSLFVIAGSAYGRTVDGVKESFLNLGLGMLFLPLFALAVRSSDHPIATLKWLAAMFVLMALTSLPILLANIHDFHESIFLIVPLGAYLILAPRFSAWRIALGLTLIGLCLFSFKNTTFLLVLLSLFACAGVWLARVAKIKNRLAVVVGAIVVAPLSVLTLVAGGVAWARHRDSLPSGNIPYREEMYSIAWRAFIDSPAWGSAFTDASVVYFKLFQVAQSTQYLPTHSDLLDLLAHGGVIAVALWLLVAKRQFAIAWFAGRTLAAREPGVDLTRHRWLAVLALIQLGAIVTYAINPVMINPVYAYWMWGSAGVMWALHQEIVAPPLPVKATRYTLMQQPAPR
jgi:hypothetical protein